MKKFKILTALFVLGSFMACEQNEENFDKVYDESGQVGLGFKKIEVFTSCGWVSGTSTGVKSDEGALMRLVIESTIKTTEDRSYNLITTSNTSGTSGHYSVGDLTIPANSYNGTVLVEFFDDGTILDELDYELVIDIDLPDGFASHIPSSTTLSYKKYQLCNDFILELKEDDGWAGERTWEVTNSDGDVVASGGPYTNGNVGPYREEFTLENGSHTLTLFDSYGDGQWNGEVAGSYSLDCGNSNVASGGDDWGSSESTEFCVNP